MSENPMRFPKVHSPFEREKDNNGNYTVIDEVNDGYSWVFQDEDVVAIEKLHGTNCCVEIRETEKGKKIEGYTRHGHQPMQKAEPYHPMTAHHNIVRAFQNSLRRGYLDEFGSGVYFGEVVGPDFHQNPHNLDENLFIPFSWLKEKCSYNSWGNYPKDFKTIKGWFKHDLFSLFNSRMHGEDLESSSVSNGTFCEGIVFAKDSVDFTENIKTEEEHLSGENYRKYTPNLAKLRRDMFSGFAQDEWPMTDYSNH